MKKRKKCIVCLKSKSIDQYWKNSKSKDGYKAFCRECGSEKYKLWKKENPQRVYELHKQACDKWRKTHPEKARLSCKRYRVKKRFGLTPEEYDKLIKTGVCEICGCTPIKIHLDHCHITSRIRGILCPKCNRGLGHFNDDSSLLMKAVQYLQSPLPQAKPII